MNYIFTFDELIEKNMLRIVTFLTIITTPALFAQKSVLKGKISIPKPERHWSEQP
jgi:hypothetical protein